MVTLSGGEVVDFVNGLTKLTAREQELIAAHTRYLKQKNVLAIPRAEPTEEQAGRPRVVCSRLMTEPDFIQWRTDERERIDAKKAKASRGRGRGRGCGSRGGSAARGGGGGRGGGKRSRGDCNDESSDSSDEDGSGDEDEGASDGSSEEESGSDVEHESDVGEEADDGYVVERILVARTYYGKMQFLTKWVGHGLKLADLTWSSGDELAAHEGGKKAFFHYRKVTCKQQGHKWPPKTGVKAQDYAEP